MSNQSYFLVGGAGFIGSHFTDALLKQSNVTKVTLFDNLSVGRPWHYEGHRHDPRFSIIVGDAKNSPLLSESMKYHDVVMHFASNADISQAATNPSIDFTEGIYLTHQVLEAARINQVKRLIYTSGSGVYGSMGFLECVEHQGNLQPISPYGASKLAGEAFISSYCHMFGLTACVFRFANVVGPRQTHGVAYDFIHQLQSDSSSLSILGDGNQSKSYIHIDDVVSAVLLANEKLKHPFEVYNISTGDYITVREIAALVVDCMNLDPSLPFRYSGGDRGWNGDVPIVRMNTDKIKALGWQCQRHTKQAIKDSILAMLNQNRN